MKQRNSYNKIFKRNSEINGNHLKDFFLLILKEFSFNIK